MKNPNSPWQRLKKSLKGRWSAPDHPGGEERFQLFLLAKDIAIFLLLPIGAIVVFKSCENATSSRSKKIVPQQVSREVTRGELSKSQIIDFKRGGGTSPYAGVGRKSPGSLVKVRLQNVVETYSNAPVHVQVLDDGLGGVLRGGTLIGDAVSDSNYERITITFRFARDPKNPSLAIPISARALGLDGTLGLEATKKEGFVTRSALGSAGHVGQEMQQKDTNSVDFKSVLFRALTAGLIQEFGSSAQVERNRAQVLTLRPGAIFFAELTDFFPKGGR